MYFVYIIYSSKLDKYYTGCTNNVNKRISQHNKKQNLSTKNGCPWELICYKKFNSRGEAFNYEKIVKSYKGGNAFKKIINGEMAEWLKAAPC